MECINGEEKNNFAHARGESECAFCARLKTFLRGLAHIIFQNSLQQFTPMCNALFALFLKLS